MSQSTLAAAGHGTVVPAPGNFRAVVNDDDSIDTSWDAVDGATYTLKELKSPDGVHDAIGITATSSHRTPHAKREYEYWVVAVRDGVESADSDHKKVSLSHSGGTPAEILQIGGAGGNWNLGIGLLPDHDHPDGLHVDTGQKDLLFGFTNPPYFMPTDDGKAVHFQSFMTGGRTSGTKFTRSELRELKSGGTGTKTWDGSQGLHVLSGTTAVLHLQPVTRRVCVGQVHGPKDDTLELQVDGPDGSATSGFQWVVTLSNGNIRHAPTKRFPVKHGYTLGVEVDWEIRVENGRATVRIDGEVQFDTDHSGGGEFFKDGCFFKTGCYVQSSRKTDPGNPPKEFAAITLRDLRLSHP
jgi:alginate lyase